MTVSQEVDSEPYLESKKHKGCEYAHSCLKQSALIAEYSADACRKQHINILTYRDAAYPSRLRNIADPPIVLYYSGVLPDFDGQPVIAVVGTRKATPYGISATKNISAQMACCGALVISGGAT